MPLPIDRRKGDHRLIFSASPGRSGSGYLAALLGRADGVNAGHERLPVMNASWLRRVAAHGLEESRDERRVKATAIRLELARMPIDAVYVDTSHLFVKTFADVVFDEFDHGALCVVNLRRDVIDVAKSFFELDELGPIRRPWHDFVPPPTAPASGFPLDIGDITSQFDLIFGYLVDSVARTDGFRRATPGVQWVDATLEDLSTAEGARALFGDLGLEPPADLDGAVMNRVNTKKAEKARQGQAVSRKLVANRLDSLLDRFGHRIEVVRFARHYDLPWQRGGR